MARLTLPEIARGVARRIGDLRPPVILALAGLVYLVYAYPGIMTQDSYDQLTEARRGVYTDGHPPALAEIWRIVDAVIAGPFGLLLIQGTTFLAGLYLVFRRAFEPRAAAWWSAGVFVFPPVMVVMVMIWKDCIMAGFLMLGAGGLVSPRRAARIAGLGCMMLATAVRYNALAATLPMIVLLLVDRARRGEPGFAPSRLRDGMPWLERYAIALAAWLLVTLAALGINRALTDKPMYIWHSSLAVYDIVGTLAFVDDDRSDAELARTLEGTNIVVERDLHRAIRAVYSPRDFLPIIKASGRPDYLWDLPINGVVPAPAAQRDALSRAWWDAITGDPFAYLQHRLAVMAEVLSLTQRPHGVVARRAFTYRYYTEAMGIGTGWSKLQHKLSRWLTAVAAHTPLFVPWIYVLVALLLVPFALRHRDVLALLASGLLFEATLLVLAPSPDYRYSHWLIVCTVISIIILTTRRMRTRVQPS